MLMPSRRIWSDGPQEFKERKRTRFAVSRLRILAVRQNMVARQFIACIIINSIIMSDRFIFYLGEMSNGI